MKVMVTGDGFYRRGKEVPVGSQIEVERIPPTMESRLAPVGSVEAAESEQDEKTFLVNRAKELGIKGVSKQWGIEKLQEAIEEAEGGEE